MLSEKNQNALIKQLYLCNPELARIFILGTETGLSYSAIKNLYCYNVDIKNKLIYRSNKRYKLTKKACIVVQKQLQEQINPLQITNPRLFNLKENSSCKYLGTLKKLVQNKCVSTHIHRLCFLNNYSDNQPNIYSV